VEWFGLGVIELILTKPSYYTKHVLWAVNFRTMLKVYLKLRATKDIEKTGWKKGDVMEMINDVFDKQNGVAYWSLHQDWEILKMEIREFKEIHV
jgi:hypothetical protein